MTFRTSVGVVSLRLGILITLIAVGLLFTFGQTPSHAALDSAKTLSEEQHEVDDLLAKADSVELRKLSPRVFELANRLLKEKGDAEARPYFEKGLQANPWALKEQLTLGGILTRHGQPNALREKAEMVLRVGEEDEDLERAARALGRVEPPVPPRLADIKETGTVLILVPVGTLNPLILQELRDDLAKRLGIKVAIASVDLQVPLADRTARQQWVSRTRERILKVIDEHPAVGAQLAQWGFTLAQITKDDDALVAMMRKSIEVENGKKAVQTLDDQLLQLASTPQWDVARMLPLFQSVVGKDIGPKRLALGVTSCDLYGGTSNFLFGVAAQGGYVGLISTNRFRAAFCDESPKRERLIERLRKQSLSTVGFMLGVPRCTTPECARAFPQSIAEHDQKPSTLCPTCRAGFEAALGHPLPAN